MASPSISAGIDSEAELARVACTIHMLGLHVLPKPGLILGLPAAGPALPGPCLQPHHVTLHLGIEMNFPSEDYCLAAFFYIVSYRRTGGHQLLFLGKHGLDGVELAI